MPTPQGSQQALSRGALSCWHHKVSRQLPHKSSSHSRPHSVCQHRPACRQRFAEWSCSATSPSNTLQQGQHTASQQQSNMAGMATQTMLEQPKLHWWTSHSLELQQLEQHVAQLLSLAQTDTLQPGPELLELLAAVAVGRSNMLRPAGYFADCLARSAPQQAAAARALQDAAAELTAPVYSCMPLLVLLLATVAGFLQQLAAAAQQVCEQDDSKEVQHSDLSAAAAQAPAVPALQRPGTLSWVHVAAGGPLLVAPAVASTAAAKAAAALHLAQQAAATAAAAAAGSPAPCAAAAGSTAASKAPCAAAVSGACATAVAALRLGLDALEAALNGTLPADSIDNLKSASSTGTRNTQATEGIQHSTIKVLPAIGCPSLCILMVCRQLLASWLPPVAAQAEVAAAAAGATGKAPVAAVGAAADVGTASEPPSASGIVAGSCMKVGGSKPPERQVAASRPSTTSSSATGPTAAEPGFPADSHEGLTVRQLLQQALRTLAAVSSSSVTNTSLAPLLLLTQDQAAVIQPLLQQAGLDCADTLVVQQQQQAAAATDAPGTNRQHPNQCPSAGNTKQGGLPSAFLPLVSHGPCVGTGDKAAAAGTTAERLPFSCITTGQDGFLQLHISPELEVHPGFGGCLRVFGLLDITEQAQQMLDPHTGACQAQQQAPGGQEVGSTAPVCFPADNSLRLLRISTDVLQLLLSHHPHPGVRQQMYHSGLLPLLHLQDQVLGVVTDLRQQLAAGQGESQGYAQLVLSGSCLGGAAAAGQFVQQLLPFARQHAAAEWQELQQLAARQARADGRRLGPAEAAVQPWDVAFASLRLVKQLTELDWGRDLAPYFTLPGLISRIDRLLHTSCQLRLLPVHSPQVAAALAQQQHQYQLQSTTAGSFQPWGSHVLHLLLLADPPPSQGADHQPLQHVPQLLGHVLLELVSGGFPSCTLLQLPTPANLPAGPQGSQAVATQLCPGSVVLRVPVPAAGQVFGFGQQGLQPQSNTSDVPLALPGPAALQAVLHELGHALSYLCPSRNLLRLLQAQTAAAGDTTAGEMCGSSRSSSSGLDVPCAQLQGVSDHVGNASWLVDGASTVGQHCLCLLSGPPVGLDVRETSSHMFEHWVRHPASIRVLSRHERLDAPLPQATAIQLPRIMTTPGGCSSIRLYNTLLEALSDLDLHSAGAHSTDCIPSATSRTIPCSPPVSNACSNRVSDGAISTEPTRCHTSWFGQQRFAVDWQQQSIPASTVLLDDVEAAATAGPVGGAKAAYVAARLLASAAWKLLGFEQDPIQPVVCTGPAALGQAGLGGQHPAAGGEWMAEVLLSSGAFLPSHHTVIQLLGGSADVLSPVVVRQGPSSPVQLDGSTCAQAAAAPAEGTSLSDSHVCISGWQPNLYHDVFQDIELA